LAGATGLAAGAYVINQSLKPVLAEQRASPNYALVRKDIEDILEAENYDDGSYAPILVRLAWHSSGTFCKHTKNGGSDGGTMRFKPESDHGANAGLQVARDLLEPLKKKHPDVTYADLYVLAGCVAIEHMGGPHIPFRPGRSDVPKVECPEKDKRFSPDGRLPDAAQGAYHVRDIFYRMGFNDQEIVALIGAHAVGRCHKDRSGFDGPWTRSPTTFSNQYFVELLDNKWTKRSWKGPEQFEDPSGDLMMLPADMALIEDLELKKWVQIYAKDQVKFFADFQQAFLKLTELGVKFEKKQSKSGGGISSWFGGGAKTPQYV
jgi:catalase (peroxidase I)